MTEPIVEGVGDLLVLEDGTGPTLELHYVRGNDHTDGMLVAYVPEVDGGSCSRRTSRCPHRATIRTRMLSLLLTT